MGNKAVAQASRLQSHLRPQWPKMRWRRASITGYNGRMNLEEIRNAVRAQPFRPFTLHLADGRHIPVKHSEFAFITPSGRALIVYQPDESSNVIDIVLVTDIAFGSNGRAPGKRRRGRG